MAAGDIVDTEALIFTEANVYSIAGYLVGHFDVDADANEVVAAVETAILYALNDGEKDV